MYDIELKENIYKLSENVTEEKNIELDEQLKELLKPYKNGSVGIAQINLTAGNIEYNAKKIIKYICHASNIDLDLVVFPALTLTGFPLEDTIAKYPNLAQESLKWLEQIAKITNKTYAVVGFIEPTNSIEGKKYYNSVGILGEGKIQKIIRLNNLPAEYEHHDSKYFQLSSGKDMFKVNVNGIEYGIIFCGATAENISVPQICVNQVGATDSVSFVGESKVYDISGELISRAKSFEEQFLIVNPLKNLGKIYPSAKNEKPENFTLNYEYDLERTYKTILQGIKDYFNKTGFKRAVLGLSGGLDSTICAVLLADALGSENVFGISMPSKITSSESKNDAQILAQNLGINFIEAPIKDMVETTNCCLQNIFEQVEKNWDIRYKKSFTMDNIQARSRAVFLWGVSNEFEKCLPIATSDKSEIYVGYATINGDMSGGFAPIADVVKTKLFALARWLNKNRTVKNVIPQSVIDKRPGAELAIDSKTGKPLIAEDALMPYEFMDEIIWRIENKQQDYNYMLNSEFLYEKQNKISKEQKIQWLDKFYRRMAGALYKGSILPPSIKVDNGDINRYNYKQPISSGNINFKEKNENEIEQIVKNSLL